MKMRVYIPAHPVQTLLFFDRNNAKRSDCYDLGCALLFPQRDSSSYYCYWLSTLSLLSGSGFALPLLLLPRPRPRYNSFTEPSSKHLNN